MRTPPAGFVQQPLDGGWAWWRREQAAGLQAAGLENPRTFVSQRPDLPGTGRGPRGSAETPAGAVWVKQCLRGGFPARLNAERYFSLGRFRREVEVVERARGAGLPVLPIWGLVFNNALPGWRVWQITPLVERAPDLFGWFSQPLSAERAEALFEAAVAQIARLHAAGLHHRDLNLGNLLVRARDGGGWELTVIDLDRAAWHAGGVPQRLRRRAFERFERSWRGVLGPEGPVPARRRREVFEAYLGLAPDSA